MQDLSFPSPMDTDASEALRAEVRQFVEEELGHRGNYSYLGGHDPEFSQKVGRRGWIGMTWPKQYGGAERSVLERYVVAEELLAARAPLGAHWVGDRQTGPLLLRYGTEAQRQLILPGIVNGTLRLCIGMSEPDSGSDLASVRTRADKVDGGFVVNGTKIWTSGAHKAHYMVLLCRTSPRSDARHEGLSQLLVDMRTPGIECRQIESIAGDDSFNEVFFKDAFIPDDMLVGELGQGWEQVTSELAFERAGPERLLSTFGLLIELIDALGHTASERATIAVGRLVSHLVALRRLSRSVATMLQLGQIPALQAALVKDLGTSLEQEICEVVRTLVVNEPDPGSHDLLANALAQAILRAPSCSIRGGTREVLRGVIARGIGLR
ncbi:MAG: acyl-CoA dehydrogenase family protein [Cupriavidus necator]